MMENINTYCAANQRDVGHDEMYRNIDIAIYDIEI